MRSEIIVSGKEADLEMSVWSGAGEEMTLSSTGLREAELKADRATAAVPAVNGVAEIFQEGAVLVILNLKMITVVVVVEVDVVAGAIDPISFFKREAHYGKKNG